MPREQQGEHQARHDGAGRVDRIIPGGAGKMSIGEEAPIIVKAKRMLIGEPANHHRIREHPQ